MTLKVFADKGHGANDPGGVGYGMKEADIVNDIVNYFVDELNTYDGVEVKVGPRPAGSTSTERLGPRTAQANAWGADYFISFHTNANHGTGYEGFVQEGASAKTRQLAKTIHDEIYTLFKANGLKDRGLKEDNLFVLRTSKMPSTLLEFGFIDTESDAKLLKQDSFRKQCGIYTARGVAKAFKLTKKSGSTPAATTGSSKTTECSIVVNGKALSTKGFVDDTGTSFLPVKIIGGVVGRTVGFVNGKVTIAGTSLATTVVVGDTGYAASKEIAKAIGYTLGWDGKKATVTLTQ